MLVLVTRGMAFDFSCHVSSYFNPNPNKPIKNTCPVTQEHLHAARLCHLVYDDEYLHKSERFVDSPSTDVQCSMSVDDLDASKLYVVFRGSDDSTDWSHNFDMNLVPYPSKSRKQLHAGFLVQWLSVREEVHSKVAEMIQLGNESGSPIQSIVFTGHSAGSPPACLCALEIEALENIEARVVTFGSPRFSNEAFKDSFEASLGIQKCTRFVLDRDLVTRFPLNFSNGYRHVGSPLQLRDGHILERDTTNFETFRWFVLGLPRFDFGVRDHDISNYVEKIENCVNGKIEN